MRLWLFKKGSSSGIISARSQRDHSDSSGHVSISVISAADVNGMGLSRLSLAACVHRGARRT